MKLYIVTHEQEDNLEEVIPFPTREAADQFCHDLLLPMWREAFGDKPWSDDPDELLSHGMADVISEKIDPPGLNICIWEKRLVETVAAEDMEPLP